MKRGTDLRKTSQKDRGSMQIIPIRIGLEGGRQGGLESVSAKTQVARKDRKIEIIALYGEVEGGRKNR